MRGNFKRRLRKMIASMAVMAMAMCMVSSLEFPVLADDYQPRRYVTIDSTSDINPTAHLIFPTEWQNKGALTLTGKVKIESLASLGSGTNFFINNAAAVHLASYTANTNGWIDVNITAPYSAARFIFGGWYAAGKMYFADVEVKASDGTVLYSLADDGALDPFEPTENLVGTRGWWIFQTYNNVSKFTSTTVEEPVPYEPNREFIINGTSDINPTAHFLFPSDWANKGPFTVTGKVKIESLTSLGSGTNFFINNAAAVHLASYTSNTDGWVDFNVSSPYSDGRVIFGGWYAGGKMRVGDLKITGSDGSVLYTLATDPVFDPILPDTDIVGTRGNWIFQRYNNVSTFGVKTWGSRNRYFIIDSTSDINPTAHLLFPTAWANKGTLYFTGRVKITGLASLGSGTNFFINNAAAAHLASYTSNTDGWVDFAVSAPYSDGRIIFGGWYARGEMSVADFEVKASDGSVLYSFADDDTFSVFSNKENIVGYRGDWIFQRYNNMSKFNVIDPWSPNDYLPERSLYISPSTDINSTAHFLFQSEWSLYGTLYLVGYLKVENFNSLGSGASFYIYNSTGQAFKIYTANTGGYQKVIIPATFSDGRFVFGSWYASGNFVLSDLEIRKQDGSLLYSLANDTAFDNLSYDTELMGSKGRWILQKYNNLTKFTVRDKVNAVRYITIDSTTDINPTAHLIFPSSWSSATCLNLTGKIKIENFSSQGSGSSFYIYNQALQAYKIYTGNTEHWLTLNIQAKYSDGRFIFGGWYAGGKMKIADLRITNQKGEILYDLADDTSLDDLQEGTDIVGHRSIWILQKYNNVSKFLMDDYRQMNYTMTSGKYSVQGSLIYAAVSSSMAEDFLGDVDSGIDGKVKLYNGATQVTNGYAATGMKVNLYNRNNQLLSQYDVAIKGDLNADGVVNSSDITEMQAHISHSKTFTGVFLKAGDLNGDNLITSADVTLEQQLISGYAGAATNVVIDSYNDIVLMTPSSNGASSGTMSIVNQRNRVATIVVSAYAPPKVLMAAENLQDTLFKMTGARLEIVNDSGIHTGNLILVGDSRYTRREGFAHLSGYPNGEKVILKTLGNRLILMGNDCGNYTGTQNAVTMFLESLGCGWYGPSELWEEIPDKANITVGKFQIEHTPQFTSRITNVYNTNRQMGYNWYQGGDLMLFGHAMYSLITRESYFASHPEWFCLVNGQRAPYSVQWWQYCYSDQALATEMGNKIIQFFDQNPNYVQYTLAANDGHYHGWCECSVCNALGSESDQILTFANRVAAVVAAKYPHKKLTILSYFPTFYAPTRNFTMASNLEVQFTRETNLYQPVSSGFDMGSAYYSESDNTYTVTWKDNVANWQARASTQSYGIYEWYCIAAAKTEWQYIPWVQGRVAIQNQQYWKSIGCTYVFYDQGPEYEYKESESSYDIRWPLWYVASKGMWDGSLTSEQILRDACRKLYGNAANAMYDYYQTLENISAGCTQRSIAWYPTDTELIYTANNVSAVDAKLAVVSQALSSVTAKQRARIENQIAVWQTAKLHI